MAVDIAALKREIDADPLGRGYAVLRDEQVADSLNAIDRPVDTLTSAQLQTFAADGTLQRVELIKNSEADEDEIAAAVAAVAPPTSVPNRQTREQELRLGGIIRPGHVQEARR